MQQGIYRIVNIVNGKFYLGSSANFKRRWAQHRSDLRCNHHHSVPLQRAWIKYGEENFRFEVVEETEDILTREQYYLDTLNPPYNVGKMACGGDNLTNNPNRAAIIEKIRSGLVRRMNQPEEKARRSTAAMGDKNINWKGGAIKQHTTCACGKQKQYSAKECHECRDRNGVRNPFFGKSHSAETKKKLREGMLGKKPANRRKAYIEGRIFDSCMDAARFLGVCQGTITFRMKSKHWDYHYVD